jgi:hypothetical protein
MSIELKLPINFGELAKLLCSALLAGTPSGFGLAAAFGGQGEALRFAVLGSVGGAFLVGLLYLALLWRRDGLASSERIAGVMAALQKDFNDRNDAMRREIRDHYRELLSDVLTSRGFQFTSLNDLEAEKHLRQTGSFKRDDVE